MQNRNFSACDLLNKISRSHPIHEIYHSAKHRKTARLTKLLDTISVNITHHHLSAMSLFAIDGDKASIQYLYQTFNASLSLAALGAAMAGNAELLKDLEPEGYCKGSAVLGAAIGDQDQLVSELLDGEPLELQACAAAGAAYIGSDKFFTFSDACLEDRDARKLCLHLGNVNAALACNWEFINTLKAKELFQLEAALFGAAHTDNQAFIDHLDPDGNPSYTNTIKNGAIRARHLELFRKLNQDNPHYESDELTGLAGHAAASGDFYFVEHFLSQAAVDLSSPDTFFAEDTTLIHERIQHTIEQAALNDHLDFVWKLVLKSLKAPAREHKETKHERNPYENTSDKPCLDVAVDATYEKCFSTPEKTLRTLSFIDNASLRELLANHPRINAQDDLQKASKINFLMKKHNRRFNDARYDIKIVERNIFLHLDAIHFFKPEKQKHQMIRSKIQSRVICDPETQTVVIQSGVFKK